jgi:NADH-quinone oxidoreductase subunit I
MGGHAHDDDEPKTSGPVVVGVSDKNPRVRVIRVVRPTPEDTTFIQASIKGLGITLKHFFRNVVGKRDVETIQYPEETYKYPPRTRGLHRLMRREDDATVRCVACMMCPTVCPANCITIVPEESEDGRIEKRPAIFEIDELRCVVCGFCVEACPCDAIRMDTGMHAKPVEHRADAIMDKPHMLELGVKSTAVQGGRGPEWREGGLADALVSDKQK